MNEKPGFVSFDASFCTITEGLAGSAEDWEGIDCSGVNGFEPPVELTTPNPVNGVPDELPNVNIGGVSPFCSELVVAGLGSVVVVVGEGWTFVDSRAGL